jgi:Tol biopolymer transport system component
VRPDGTHRRTLTTGKFVNRESPAYRPDGRRIVFDWGGRLYTVRSSGKGVDRLTSPKASSTDYRPDW